MKKAIAKVNKDELIKILRLPHGIELVSAELKSKTDDLKIVVTGDSLPVKETKTKNATIPILTYEVMPHWHCGRFLTKEQKDAESK